MRIVMTGSTGLLGSNFLLEWIKNYLPVLETLEIVLLGRQKKERHLEARIRDTVLGPQGLAYLACAERVKELEVFLKTRVKYIDYDLSLPGLGISDGDKNVLRCSPIDFFFHIASSTDFRNTPGVDRALERVIVEGTRDLLLYVDTFSVKEFIYVGTAYSCGYKGGKLPPDIIDFNVKFRNPYEKRKLQTEVMVRDYCRKKGLRLRVFRPSTICGRLMEKPLGTVTKFDVFYSWVAWYLREKLKKGVALKAIYETPLTLPVRICCRADSGLNIVPADYAAKVMYQVCVRNWPGESYYLVNNHETPHRHYVSWMLELVNVQGGVFVDSLPENKTDVEKLYYKTIGSVFTPYVVSDPMLFSCENIKGLFDARLSCPEINRTNFMHLLFQAKANNFGLSRNAN